MRVDGPDLLSFGRDKKRYRPIKAWCVLKSCKKLSGHGSASIDNEFNI